MPAQKTGFWANAFQVAAPEPLSKEEKDWLSGIGRGLARRGLGVPAILFLESTKPLHFVAGQATRFVDPIFSLVVPEHQLGRLAEVLEKRESAEFLIRTTESHGR